MRDYQTHGLAPKQIFGVVALVIPTGYKTAELVAMGGAAVTFTGLKFQYDPVDGTYAGTLPVGVPIPGVTQATFTAGQTLAFFFKT